MPPASALSGGGGGPPGPYPEEREDAGYRRRHEQGWVEAQRTSTGSGCVSETEEASTEEGVSIGITTTAQGSGRDDQVA